MAKIINLRTKRKQSARDTARAEGDISAAKHGLSAVERRLSKARAAKANRDLDGHQRDAKDPE